MAVVDKDVLRQNYTTNAEKTQENTINPDNVFGNYGLIDTLDTLENDINQRVSKSGDTITGPLIIKDTKLVFNDTTGENVHLPALRSSTSGRALQVDADFTPDRDLERNVSLGSNVRHWHTAYINRLNNNGVLEVPQRSGTLATIEDVQNAVDISRMNVTHMFDFPSTAFFQAILEKSELGEEYDRIHIYAQDTSNITDDLEITANFGFGSAYTSLIQGFTPTDTGQVDEDGNPVYESKSYVISVENESPISQTKIKIPKECNYVNFFYLVGKTNEIPDGYSYVELFDGTFFDFELENTPLGNFAGSRSEFINGVSEFVYLIDDVFVPKRLIKKIKFSDSYLTETRIPNDFLNFIDVINVYFGFIDLDLSGLANINNNSYQISNFCSGIPTRDTSFLRKLTSITRITSGFMQRARCELVDFRDFNFNIDSTSFGSMNNLKWIITDNNFTKVSNNNTFNFAPPSCIIIGVPGSDVASGLRNFNIRLTGMQVTGSEYVTLFSGQTNQITLASCNVGAPGTFAENPQDAGMLYQWNRKTGWSATDPIESNPTGTTWDNTIPTGATWSTQNDPSPAGYRVMTMQEAQFLIGSSFNDFVFEKNVECLKISDNNKVFVFIPKVNYRIDDGNLQQALDNGYIALYEQYNTNQQFAMTIEENATVLPASKTFALPVRCVKIN